AAPAGGSPPSTTDTSRRNPIAATRPAASRPTDADHHPAGSGSTPRTGRSDPAPTCVAPPARAHRSGTPESFCDHDPDGERSPRSTNPDDATRTPPRLPPRKASPTPEAAVTNTATNAGTARTGRPIWVGKMI